MSKLKQVNYEIRKSYDDSWYLEVNSRIPLDSPEEGLTMAKALYVLEDKANIEATVRVYGNDAVDLILGTGE